MTKTQLENQALKLLIKTKRLVNRVYSYPRYEVTIDLDDHNHPIHGDIFDISLSVWDRDKDDMLLSSNSGTTVAKLSDAKQYLASQLRKLDIIIPEELR